MLTLTRGLGERIIIGDNIVIEVRAILDNHQVRIAIEAPPHIPVHRAEHFTAVSEANLAAATGERSDEMLAALARADSSSMRKNAADESEITGAAGDKGS